MFEHHRINELDDFFIDLSKRPGRGVYFYRINGYTDEIGKFIRKYYETARLSGVIIEGKIPNPNENNLSYYDEIMGMEFQMSLGFITDSLKKWLPRMNDYQRNNVASSIYDSLDLLRKSGKNNNMLKNAYIKFMCWLYYKFERIVNLLGQDRAPKILYEGDISNYELMLISVLSNAGCDVILLQYHGDQAYLKLDPSSAHSYNLQVPAMKAFPQGFSLKHILEQIQEDIANERLYGNKPSVINCTNAWISGKGLDDIMQPPSIRGTDPKLFYNCYCRINGVEDKLIYVNELYQFYQGLKSGKRNVVIVNGKIKPPTPEEIAGIRRKNYSKQDQMLMNLTGNIQYPSNAQLQRLMIKAFLDIMLEAAGQPGENLNRLTNKAVYLLCWLKRYQQELFLNWQMPDIACFIHMGGCGNETEAMFIKMLARLPVDILILNPNLNLKCCLSDSILYEINNAESLNVEMFPKDNAQVKMGTAAYQAERELDTLMYQDSGIYRNQQYQKADTINLQTMYEEIKILWDEEVKYRPNFSTTDTLVNIPVIFSKVSGVKDGQVAQYWAAVNELITEDTFVIKNVPYIEPTAANPVKSVATEFYRNGRLLKTKIKSHPCYQYGFLREGIQNHILDKLQILIDQKLIKGTFENGTEYTIIATVLNLPKEILRMLQKFDFTKKNPKLIYINTGEKIISLEDSILVAFLNLVGFDIVFFVPTGYQSVEKYFNRKLMEEHQTGEYVYDLTVPDELGVSQSTRPKSWRDRIFKRGM